MELDNQPRSIWVNWEKEIISFHKDEGFVEVQFPNRSEMIAFAVERSNEGFFIQ